jgi:UTP-glucose-1-phosphate uridylyltransferase
MKKEKWVQKAFAKHKAGSLHRQLGVSITKKLPKTFLVVIKKTTIGKVARNPTEIGKRRVTVTKLLKKRAVLAHTARKFK